MLLQACTLMTLLATHCTNNLHSSASANSSCCRLSSSCCFSSHSLTYKLLTLVLVPVVAVVAFCVFGGDCCLKRCAICCMSSCNISKYPCLLARRRDVARGRRDDTLLPHSKNIAHISITCCWLFSPLPLVPLLPLLMFAPLPPLATPPNISNRVCIFFSLLLLLLTALPLFCAVALPEEP